MSNMHLVRAPALRSLFLLCLILMAPACGDDAGNELEIAGTWRSNFDTEETISSRAWGTQSVVSFDNADNVAITQNPVDAEFDPEKFNKILWTEPEGDSFYYCTVDFGLDTAELAEASTNTADASDPEATGCGGVFSWTKLTRIEP